MISHLRHKLLKRAYDEQNSSTGISLQASFKLCKAAEVIRTSRNLIHVAHEIGFNMKLTSAAREVQLAIQGFENEGKDTNKTNEKTSNDSFILPAKKETKEPKTQVIEMISYN